MPRREAGRRRSRWRVIATDASEEQIRHAVRDPRIEYRVAASERSGLAETSMDLVTVASAVHWFDLDAFSREVRRVARPGGVLAVWSYHVGRCEAPFDEIFRRFYRDVLAPYFPRGAKFVDERYETLALPGEPIEMPPFCVRAEWTLDRLLGFIESWSGVQEYRRAEGRDPVAPRVPELKALWGALDAPRALRWPLILRVSRL